MPKFTKGFPEELLASSINCIDGVYSKGFFSYTWHYKTENFIFEFDDSHTTTHIRKIVRRFPWYIPNEIIYDNGWILGNRIFEHQVQKEYNEMFYKFKERKKKLEKASISDMSYKEANDFLNRN